MQVKPEYESVEEFTNIASALVSRFPEIYSGVDVDKIRCVAITNKSRGKKKKLWEVKAVDMPVRMDCPYAWYVTVYMEDWAEMDVVHRQHIVAESLCAIPEDGEEGKVVQQDMKGYSVIMRTFGIEHHQHEVLPDLLQDDINWKP